MIVEYIRYSIGELEQKQFISAYSEASVPLLKSEFCLAYDMCQCVEDNSQFTVRIHWSSAEDHMQKFRKSHEFKQFFALIKAFVGNIDEMRHYEVLESHAK